MAGADVDPQNLDPGDGPGKGYVTEWGIAGLGLYLFLLTIVLIVLLRWVWPSCDGDQAPIISSIDKSSGSVAGGNPVTFKGSGFSSRAAVTFGGIPATAVTSRSPIAITATAPMHEPGRVDVELLVDSCIASIVKGGYTYVASQPAPTGQTAFVISSIDPAAGNVKGGTTVTISGSGFATGDQETFGGVKSATTRDATTGALVAVAPAHGAGRVDLEILRDNKASSLPVGFSYYDQITASSIQPSSGSIRGCEPLTLIGSGFVDGVTVTVGATPAQAVAVNSPTSLTVVMPRHPRGKADVVVALGSSVARLSGAYNYTCPSPSDTTLFVMVLLAGAIGSALHAMRSFFMYVGSRKLVMSWVPMYLMLPVTGATIAAIFYLIVGAGLFTLTGSEPGYALVGLAALVGLFSAQAVEKLKNIAEGLFSKVGAGSEHLTESPLTLTSVKPDSGPAAGGTVVKIGGGGFLAGTTVSFGGTPATAIAVVSPTEMSATTPAHAAGKVDVTIGRDGKPPATLKGGFAYV